MAATDIAETVPCFSCNAPVKRIIEEVYDSMDADGLVTQEPLYSYPDGGSESEGETYCIAHGDGE